jgi:hypothetical protein
VKKRYPNHGAWVIDYPKREIKRAERLTELHQFLVTQTEWVFFFLYMLFHLCV